MRKLKHTLIIEQGDALYRYNLMSTPDSDGIDVPSTAE